MDESKIFEAAQELAQSISQWALLTIGASMILIVSADYYRPESRGIRKAYFLFIPAWVLLAWSIYDGIEVQSHYVAYLRAAYGKKTSLINTIFEEMNEYARYQVRLLEAGLAFVAMWLLIYLLWWILSDKIRPEAK